MVGTARVWSRNALDLRLLSVDALGATLRRREPAGVVSLAGDDVNAAAILDVDRYQGPVQVYLHVLHGVPGFAAQLEARATYGTAFATHRRVLTDNTLEEETAATIAGALAELEPIAARAAAAQACASPARFAGTCVEVGTSAAGTWVGVGVPARFAGKPVRRVSTPAFVFGDVDVVAGVVSVSVRLDSSRHASTRFAVDENGVVSVVGPGPFTVADVVAACVERTGVSFVDLVAPARCVDRSRGLGAPWTPEGVPAGVPAGAPAGAPLLDVVIVGCGKAKAAHRAPALDLYTSPYARAKARWARSVAHRVYVLSARHGLIDANTPIDPYDTRAGDVDAVDEATLARQADELGLRGRITVLAGAEYRDLLERASGGRVRAVEPFGDLARAQGLRSGLGTLASLMNAHVGVLPVAA